MEKRTIDSILKGLKELVETKQVIPPEKWIDAALYLETLKFYENERLLALNIIAKKKLKEIRENVKSATDAKIEWETTPEWEEWQRKEMKHKDILEFIRIAKKEGEIRRL